MTAGSLCYTASSSQESLHVLVLHRLTFSSLLPPGQPLRVCLHAQFQSDHTNAATERPERAVRDPSETARPAPRRPQPPPVPWRHPAGSPAAGGRAEGAAPSPARAGRGGPVPGATASHRRRRSGDGHGASRELAACSGSSPAAARRTAGIREPRRAGERGAGPGRLCLLLPGAALVGRPGKGLCVPYAGCLLPPRRRMRWEAGEGSFG